MDKNELYRIKDELLKSKAQDLEQIEDHKEYAIRAAEQSEERFRKMMQIGKEKQDIEHKNITQEIIEKKVIIEPLKIKDEVKVNGSGIKIVNPPVEELVIRRETNRKSR